MPGELSPDLSSLAKYYPYNDSSTDPLSSKPLPLTGAQRELLTERLKYCDGPPSDQLMVMWGTQIGGYVYSLIYSRSLLDIKYLSTTYRPTESNNNNKRKAKTYKVESVSAHSSLSSTDCEDRLEHPPGPSVTKMAEDELEVATILVGIKYRTPV